jgi:hypothetical protein
MAKRGPKPQVCPDLLVGMIASYKSGSTIIQIADDNDFAGATVWNHLHRAGVAMRPPGRRKEARA